LLNMLDQVGMVLNWLFQTVKGAQCSVALFKDQFYEELLEIQAILSGPSDGNIDVISKYHLTQSFWRGAPTYARHLESRH
jgi:hypothetical protein